jgi:transcription-repair coupling factor (superfamily II helicase)
MLISSVSSGKLARKLALDKEIYCKGLFLSARWFIVSQCAVNGTNLIILPDKESAEYCASDLYSLVEGDIVFFLPDSGKGVEKSNYKSTLGVQRTSAVGKIISNSGNSSRLFIVTYPEALEELVPVIGDIVQSVMKVSVGQEISYDSIKEKLSEQGFEKVDFVSAPGQYSIRGSIIDIFSYSFNDPFRISFFGNEVEKIHVFDCNTQLSKEERTDIEIFPDLAGKEGHRMDKAFYPFSPKVR